MQRQIPTLAELRAEMYQKFDEALKNIINLREDGLVRIDNKQSSISAFENKNAEQTIVLKSKDADELAFNSKDLYDSKKLNALVGRVYESADGNASLKFRISKDTFIQDYGLNISQFNARQLLLLNAAIFDVGMHFFVQYDMQHQALAPLIREVFANIDINSFGLSKRADMEPNPKFMQAFSDKSLKAAKDSEDSVRLNNDEEKYFSCFRELINHLDNKKAQAKYEIILNDPTLNSAQRITQMAEVSRSILNPAKKSKFAVFQAKVTEIDNKIHTAISATNLFVKFDDAQVNMLNKKLAVTHPTKSKSK